MTLINKFNLIGSLLETRVDLYPSHIKVKMAIDIYGYVITVYSTISRRFNSDRYQEFIEVMEQLNPKSDGWAYINGKDKYYHICPTQDKPTTKLFVCGNISPSNDLIFFNMEYVKIINENTKDGMSISIEGQFVENGKFLNVVSDNPRIFNLPKNSKAKIGQMYVIDLRYSPEYKCDDDTVITRQGNNLDYYKVAKSNKKLTSEEVEEYLLEWEIIGGE